MERYFSGTAETTNLGNWFNSANFVIGIHDGDKYGLIGDRSPNIIGIDTAMGIYGHIAGLETKALQELAGMQHRMVFYGRGNQMVAFFLRGKRHTFNGKIITF